MPTATIDPALPPTPCLDRPAASSQKGGTLIAAEVHDLAAQERALANPDTIRPDECRCGCGTLHVHDRKPRVLAGHGGGPVTVDVLIFRCARCKGVWRVLPGFLARCLWRAWSTVTKVLERKRTPVPKRTRQRWRLRLRERASVLVAVLASSGRPEVVDAVEAVGRTASRHAVLEALGGAARLARLAALVHHLRPGVRVM